MKTKKNKRRNNYFKYNPNKRMNFLIIILFFLFVIIISRLCFLTINMNHYYKMILNKETNNIVYKDTSPRGRIYDRNNKLLVDNISVKKIYYLKKIGELLHQLEQIRKYTPFNDFYLNDIHESNFIVNPYKKTITAVVFDMDGVLFDTERIYMECWREAAEPTGLKNVDEISKACIGRTLQGTKEVFEAAKAEQGIDISFEKLHEDCSRRFKEKEERDGLPEKPGVHEILEYLKKQGIL